MTTLGVVFAGGGTGGHLYPSLAILEQLQAIGESSVEAVFVCSDREVDRTILQAADVSFQAVHARPPSLRPLGLIRFMKNWGPTVRSCRAILKDLESRCDDVHLVTMGGFVAPPVVQAARAEKCPVTLVNIDAVPGRANRWIARRAARRLSTSPMHNPRWDDIPPIVRAAAIADSPAPACRRLLGLDPQTNTLFVTGASLGAHSINMLMARLVETQSDMFKSPQPWQVIHQTGPKDTEYVRRAYADVGIKAVVEPFFEPMGPAWGAADLAISRAGAGSVAEAWANCTPCLFLPYPYHKDQHQRLNAQPLVEAGGAMVHSDLIDADANVREIGPKLQELMAEGSLRAKMAESLHLLGPADGARCVARALVRPKAP